MAWVPMVLGMALISAATPWVSATVRERWFAMPQFIALMPIPLATAALLIALRWSLAQPRIRADLCWLPFVLNMVLFVVGAGMVWLGLRQQRRLVRWSGLALLVAGRRSGRAAQR